MSKKAVEFIDDQEILDTLAYAEANKRNAVLIDEIIEKAGTFKGLTHREPVSWKNRITSWLNWRWRSKTSFMAIALSCLRPYIFPIIVSMAASIVLIMPKIKTSAARS